MYLPTLGREELKWKQKQAKVGKYLKTILYWQTKKYLENSLYLFFTAQEWSSNAVLGTIL